MLMSRTCDSRVYDYRPSLSRERAAIRPMLKLYNVKGTSDENSYF